MLENHVDFFYIILRLNHVRNPKKNKMKTIVKLLLVFMMFGVTLTLNGQVRVDLKRKIENKVNQRANQKADQAIDKGLDAVEEGIKNDASKSDKKDQQDKNQNNESDQSIKNDNQSGAEKSGGQEQTKLQSYSKYDFIPGEKVIFYEDFSQDAIGDFPALWNTNGTAEVVTTNLYPGNWMKFVMRECVWTDALLNLPDNYTIEFDIIPIKGEENYMGGYYLRLMQAKNVKAWDSGSSPGNGGFCLHIESSGRPTYHTWFLKPDCQQTSLQGFKDDKIYYQKENQKYHIAMWIQKSRIRVYQDQNKMIDLPRAFQTDCLKPDRLRFENGAAMISNIRIAVGAPDMRSKLLTEGKLVSYGIYFDVNKDVVKPESYPTLKEIAAVLKENPDIRIKITGHTDSDGADAANLDLSKRRGASVKDELVKSFGIDASRIESDGAGETKPVAPNDNPANKALNRRVEFIKL
jgi:outer membrane protein OmpA-like peptidoglycan-associated protein